MCSIAAQRVRPLPHTAQSVSVPRSGTVRDALCGASKGVHPQPPPLFLRPLTRPSRPLPVLVVTCCQRLQQPGYFFQHGFSWFLGVFDTPARPLAAAEKLRTV
jgi:hypothetical protein